MRPYLRTALFVVVWLIPPVAIVLAIQVHFWLEAEYPTPAVERDSTARIQHPLYHHAAVTALERFRALPGSERLGLTRRLESDLAPAGEWLDELEHSPPSILCIGEMHRPATRRFLAEQLFSRYSGDVLMLEDTPDGLTTILSRTDDGDDYVPLLGANIAGVLRAARHRNPRLRILGVDETDAQLQRRVGGSGSRDESIAGNIAAHYQPGQRHVLLLGAVHCSDMPGRLYRKLSRDATPSVFSRMRNVQVIGEHQDGPLEAFVYFLDETGIAPGSFVVVDTTALPLRIRRWFSLLDQEVFSLYRSVIVFRPHIPHPGENQMRPGAVNR